MARLSNASHRRRFSFRATVACMALSMALPIGSVVPAAHAQNEKFVGQGGGFGETVRLGLNKSIVLDLGSDAYDILVANPAVADAVTRTARRIYLFGKQVGQTNIIVFGQNGEQIASYEIEVERDVAGLEGYLARFIPGSDIRVELLNDNVVLTGTVQTPLDASRAAQLAQIFVSGGEATTGQFAQTAAASSDGGGVAINNPDSQRRSSSIVNMLQIIGEDQVTLKVTVAEVRREVMKQLGINIVGQAQGIEFGAIGQTVAQQLNLGSGLGGASSLQAYIDAMEQSGVLKTLAEPTLSAISGEQATFHVGGELSYVTGVDRETGIPLVDSKDYGIGLEFKPTVLSPGRISLKVRTSVSEPISEQTTVGNFNLIQLRKRLADTTVELPSGGSMMIAGLVNDETRTFAQSTPGLSKIPVLGALFRSRDFVRNETELVVIVTPYLARPVARNELARPDDNLNPASDGAGFFLGKVNRVYGQMKTDKPKGRYHGVVGYIYK